jgi:hypothetical protein
MGPERTRFWLPLVRLSGFVAAVVVIGTLVFQTVRPPIPEGAPEGRRVDYFSRKKRKIERHLRALERFIGDNLLSPPSKAPPARAEEEPGSGAPVDGLVPVSYTPAPQDAPLGGAIRSVELPVLLWTETDLPAFAWPEPPPPLPSPKEIDLPRFETPFHEPLLTSDFVRACYGRLETDPVCDVADAILHGPELVFDGALSLLESLVPRSGSYDWRMDESESITSRILDFHMEERQGRIFTEFLGRWVEREQRFFAKFEESYLNTYGFEDGTAEIDDGELASEQQKILWDVLRRTYFSKYRFKAEDRIRDDAFYFNEWRGMDFLVLPPLMAGYLYYRGLDKRFSMAGTWLKVSLEPLSKWFSRREDLVAGVSLEWTVKGWPIGLVVSAGLYEGDVELDFIGIGTSAGMAKKALYLERDE